MGQNGNGGGIQGGWTGPVRNPNGGGNYIPGPTGGINPGAPPAGGWSSGPNFAQTGQIRGAGGSSYGFTPPPAVNQSQAPASPASIVSQIGNQPQVNQAQPAVGAPTSAVAQEKPAVQPTLGAQSWKPYNWGGPQPNLGANYNQPQATSEQGPSGGGTSGGPGQWAGKQGEFDAFKAGRANDKPGPAGYGGGNGQAGNGYAWEGAAPQQPNAVWSNARTGQNYNGVNQPGGTVNQMPSQNSSSPAPGQQPQGGKGLGQVGGYSGDQGMQGRPQVRRQIPGQWW